MLNQNADLVEWVTCVVYGDLDGAWLFHTIVDYMDELVANRTPVNMTCVTAGSKYLAQTVVGVAWNSDDPILQYWASQFANGSAEDKLCAVLNCAQVMYHELLHVAIGLDSVDSGVEPEACHHVSVAQSLMKFALLLRFPQARASRCCDGCLSDVPYILGVNPGTRLNVNDSCHRAEGLEDSPGPDFGSVFVPVPNLEFGPAAEARSARLEWWRYVEGTANPDNIIQFMPPRFLGSTFSMVPESWPRFPQYYPRR